MNALTKRQRQAWTAERLRVQADIPDNWSPLDGTPMPEYVPDFWIGPHVGLRMIEAFRCLANMPGGHGGGTGKGYWPDYWHDWADLLAQNESDDSEKDNRIREHNRARIMPSAQDISRMEIVISWGARYLVPADAVLVQRVALMRSQDRELEAIAHRLSQDRALMRQLNRRGELPPKELRRANRSGLDRIASGLHGDRVEVF